MRAMKVILFAFAYCLTAGTVVAAEETLTFRLIVRTIDRTAFDAPVEGRNISVSQSAGVAIFEDGRLADKQFVGLVDSAGAEGTYSGYSIYTFLNGDTLTLKYTGGWGADGEVGHYEVLSGTGAYEGASGEGRFVPVDNPWDKASLYDVTINIERSDS